MGYDFTLLDKLNNEAFLDSLDTLAGIGREHATGISRIAYNPADLAARDWIETQMRATGMTVRRDPIGNTIGVYPGQDASLPALAIGSHTDTIPNAGKYDGALGVMAGLAIARALADAGMRLRRPIEVINFTAEEASMPGATFGSRAMTGQLTRDILTKTAWDGSPVGAFLRGIGIDPDGVITAARPKGAVAAYLELHIEQGGILDAEGVPIGVVKGIAGIRRYGATFYGYANHAGTTPMHGRRDALVAAAPFILFVQELGLRHGIVSTVGSLVVEPNAPNVIPGRVDLTVEIRSLDDTVLDSVEAEITDYVSRAGASMSGIVSKSPVPSDAGILAVIRQACTELGLPYRELASGAGHDAMCMAAIAPEAMIFVPSRNGVSHSPDEYTSPEDCVNGARVLFASVLRLDEMLSEQGGV